jgi:hypothetical protein
MFILSHSVRNNLAALGLTAALFAAAPALAQVPSYAPPPLQPPTYGATFTGLAVPQTGAGDAVCLVGSATKTIYIQRIAVSGVDSTAQTSNMNLVKRTTANSGGTSTNAVNAKYDTNNAAPTAVLTGYTAVPTPGTGFIHLARSIGFAAATGAPSAAIVWEFDPSQLVQQLVLRGVAQSACVNFPSAFTTAGPSLNVSYTWTER